MNIFSHILIGIFIFVCSMLIPPEVGALQPSEILVVTNSKDKNSIDLAKFYMQKRGIPEGNIIRLWIDTDEVCSRIEYQKKIREPVRNFIQQHGGQARIKCLVLMYGVPLKISAVEDSASKKAGMVNLDSVASVDSEISLALIDDYSLTGWLPNPFFVGYAKKNIETVDKNKVLLVSRLDGPTPTTVKRVINDSLMAETNGLVGTAYFDARWPLPDQDEKLSGYAYYDASLHQSALLLKKANLPVVLDDKKELFPAGSRLEAMLYCGWYSLANYVDAFSWQKGAVGYHIASAECKTLKNKKSKVWCLMMLKKGIAATIGPVGEPYVQAFPLPQLFFPLLVDGRFSLVETYFLSLPFLSWKMVLVGDPLYRPFKHKI